MIDSFDSEIAELAAVHSGLDLRSRNGRGVVLAGPLRFEATADGLATISDCFEVELTIGERYPDVLPTVRETGGRIEETYDHIHPNGTLCLAVPIEERRIFFEEPCLLGFVNRLVVPYLYGYCHWKRTGHHPFGEQAHGSEGILQYYLESTGLPGEIAVLAALSFLFEHGYRGHHPCPCGSGSNVRNCHGRTLIDLREHHTPLTLQRDFLAVLDACLPRVKDGTLSLSSDLEQQLLRILKKKRLWSRASA